MTDDEVLNRSIKARRELAEFANLLLCQPIPSNPDEIVRRVLTLTGVVLNACYGYESRISVDDSAFRKGRRGTIWYGKSIEERERIK